MNKNFLLILASSTLLITIFSFFRFSDNRPKKPIAYAPVFNACGSPRYTGEFDRETQAVYNGRKLNIPAIAFAQDDTAVLGVVSEERWIEVDISDQKLYAWDGDQLFLETPVSTGLPWWPTPTGEFRVWIKLRATKMEGGEGDYYYYLPNVPYVMFFANEDVPSWKGYGLHGTYWHDDFGTQRSHGCVNLPTEMAQQLYFWTSPGLPEGASVVKSTGSSPGTRVIIHD